MVTAMIKKIRQEIEKKNIDIVIVSKSSDIFYLTGLYNCEGYLCVGRNQVKLFTGGIYYQYAVDKLNLSEVSVEKIDGQNFYKFLHDFKRPALFSSEFSIDRWENLCKKSGKKIKRIENFISHFRSTKTNDEILKIKKAEKIAKSILEKTKNLIKPGISEIDIAGEICYQLRRNGCMEAFPTIVASGINSVYPHHLPAKRKFKHNDVIVIDMGARFDGYCSDITQTIFIGKPDDEMKKIFGILCDIHKCVNELILNGEKLCERIHYTAVNILKKFKLEQFFTHGLGHGVGIDVHELPRLGPESKDRLENNMVFTIEPGIYIPGKFGMRLENMYYYSVTAGLDR